MLALIRYVSLRHLRLGAGRALLSICGIALGVTLYVAVGLLNRATLAAFTEGIESLAGRATLQLRAAGGGGLAEGLLETVRATPGVASAAPVIEATAAVAGRGGETLTIFAVDLLQEGEVRTYRFAGAEGEEVVEDPIAFLNQPDSLLLTRTLAARWGVARGATIELITARGPRRLTVRGLLEPEGPARAFGGNLGIMDVYAAQVLFARPGTFDEIDVVTAPGASRAAVAAALAAAAGPGVQVERAGTGRAAAEEMLAAYSSMLSSVGFLSVVVAAFLIYNTMAVAVARRRRAIGIMRSLGARRRSVLALFLAEAALMGMVGSLAGAAGGRALAGALARVYMGGVSAALFFPVAAARVVAAPGALAMGLLLGTGFSLLAGLVPAYAATRVAPISAARTGAEPPRSTRSFWRGLAWAPLCLLLGAAGVLAEVRWGWGFFGMAADAGFLASFVLLAPAVLVGLAAGARGAAGARLPSLQLAAANALRAPGRATLAVAALIFALALSLSVAVMLASFQCSLSRWVDSFTGDLEVVSTRLEFDVPLAEEVGDELRAIAGVGAVRAIRFMHTRYRGQRILLYAGDVAGEEPGGAGIALHLIAGGPGAAGAALAEGSGVLVSHSFAFRFGTRVGDTIRLDSPSGPRAFRVVGINVDYNSGEGTVRLGRALYREAWRDRLVDAFLVFLAPGARVADVRREIAARLGARYNLIIQTMAEVRAAIRGIVSEAFRVAPALYGVVLLVGLLAIANTLLISVLDRTRELGLLRAAGMTRGQLERMVVSEAALLGTVGAVLGTALGAAVSRYWMQITWPLRSGWVLDYSFPAASALGMAILAVVAAGVAGYLPARRAAELSLAESGSLGRE